MSAAIALAACRESTTSVVQPSHDVVLAPGDTARFAGTGVSVVFRYVVFDVRCPEDVECVWSGNALVEFGGRPPASDLTTFRLNTDQEPRQTGVGSVLVELVGLLPLPQVGRYTRAGDYRATLRWSVLPD